MNIRSFQPRAAYVLVKRIKLTKEQTGGIIVPGSEYGNFAFATIRALGPGDSCVSHQGSETDSGRMVDIKDLEIGDTVLIKTGHDASRVPGGRPRQETTLPFTVAGERVELINQAAVIAVVTLGDEDNDTG